MVLSKETETSSNPVQCTLCSLHIQTRSFSEDYDGDNNYDDHRYLCKAEIILDPFKLNFPVWPHINNALLYNEVANSITILYSQVAESVIFNELYDDQINRVNYLTAPNSS